MERCYTEAISINNVYWAEADYDSRVECGDASVWGDFYAAIPSNLRKQYNFNRVRRIVNMISGYQRKNRKSTIIVPVENGDAQTAEQFTKIFLWLNQQEGILETISDAFQGSLVTGMNLLQVWVDYRNDPISGNIKVDNCAYNSFLIDPYFRKADLSDCNYIWKRTYLSPAECISLLPDKKEELTSMNPMGSAKDGKFQFMPENYQFNSSALFAYDEFYYRTYRKQKMLVDTQTGETLEWESEDDEALQRFLTTYPQVEVVDAMVPTVKLGIVVQGNIMYDDINPLGVDTYPFVPVLSYYNPQMTSYHLRLQGVVRNLRDAQFLYNRRKVIELDILESQVNSGFIYKEDALINPKDVFQSGQGKGIALKSTAQMTDVQQIQSPQIPPTTIELSRILSEEIQQISGVNEELLGSASDDKAGILSMLRQGAGLTTLQGLFDKLDYAQKRLGTIILKVIQNNFTPGKIQRIIEEEPSEQFYNKYFGKYDAAVEEGPNTTTQRQMAFAQGLHLREVGIPIPDRFFIENMSIQNKNDILEEMQQQAQAAQQAQMAQQQAQMQELQSRANLSEARAEADRGLAVERTSRVAENESLAIERQAEAAKDRMSGVLDLVKALKEIETIDISQLQTLVQLTQVLKAQELQSKAEAETEEQKDKGAMQPQTQAPVPEAPVGS